MLARPYRYKQTYLIHKRHDAVTTTECITCNSSSIGDGIINNVSSWFKYLYVFVRINNVPISTLMHPTDD